MDGWMDGWTDGWMIGRLDEWAWVCLITAGYHRIPHASPGCCRIPLTEI